jgi:hypothetical protein
MTLQIVVRYLLVWSTIGAIAFSIYVFAVFRSGLVYAARKQDGTLKERIPLSGLLNMLVFLLMLVGFQVLANYIGLAHDGIDIRFVALYLLNLGHYFILFLFDTLVIDGLVIGVWQPGFLRLPDEMGAESMKKHISKSIPVGIIAGAVLTAISTAISYFALFVS